MTSSQQDHPFTDFISNPDFFSFLVAFFAGTAGVLSLTAAKSGALIGVLISVTTIPAAANIGVAAALGDSERVARARWRQLSLNLARSCSPGSPPSSSSGRLYIRRRRKHLRDEDVRGGRGAADRPQPSRRQHQPLTRIAQRDTPGSCRSRTSSSSTGGGRGQRSDWDELLAMAAPGFEIDLTRANGPVHGSYGIDEVRSLLVEFADSWEALRFEPGELIDAGDDVVVPWVMHAGGRDGIGSSRGLPGSGPFATAPSPAPPCTRSTSTPSRPSVLGDS